MIIFRDFTLYTSAGWQRVEVPAKMAARSGTSRAAGSPRSEPADEEASNPIDQFLEWLETLDVPPLTRYS